MPNDPVWEETTEATDQPTWEGTLSGEDVLTGGFKTTDLAANLVNRSLQAGELASPEPRGPAPIVPPTLAGVGQIPVAPPQMASRILSAPFRALGAVGAGAVRTARDVLSPTTYLPEEEQARLRPFVIDTRGNEIRPMTPQERQEREPIQVGRPLFTAPRTQLQPQGNDITRILEEWSSPEGIAMLAAGNASRLVGYGLLATMVPSLIDDAKTIASSSATPEEKRDRINNAFLLAGMVAGHPAAREFQNQRARDRFFQDEMAVPPPIELTGAELPGQPRGFSPPRAVAGPERLGPPIPPARVRSMAEAQANLPGGPESIVTAPESGREENQLQTIRRLGLKTKAEVLEQFPALRQLSHPNERAARLLKEAQGLIGPPLPPGGVPPAGRTTGINVTTGPLQGPYREVAETRPVVEPMRVRQEPVFQGPELPPGMQEDRERQANVQREIDARRSALQQNIIFWERELEMARNRGDRRAQEEAAGQLMLFRREYEAIPPVKQITPKPPIARAPGRPFRPEVPGTAAEPREDVASTVRSKNIRTVEQLLDEYPKMRGTGGAREWARNILREIWGAYPSGAIQGPPIPPTQQGPEEPPAAPPGAPVPKPPPPPAAAPGAVPAPTIHPPEQDRIGRSPTPVFLSGANRNPADLAAAMAQGLPIGITVTEPSTGRTVPPATRQKIGEYLGRGGQVFLDSGAFDALQKGKPVDWERVMFAYRELINNLPPGVGVARGLYITAPDVIGDPAATSALQQKYMPDLQRFFRQGVNIVFPVQKEVGKTLSESVRDLPRNTDPQFGGDVVWGIPFNKKAWSFDDVQELFDSNRGSTLNLHLLGGGDADVARVMNMARESGVRLEHISGDRSITPEIRARKYAEPYPDEVIIAAAYRAPKGVESGANHPAILKRLGIEGFETPESRNTEDFGYVTNRRPFVSRELGGQIAKASGQALEDFNEAEKVHSDQIASPVQPDKPLGDVPTRIEDTVIAGKTLGEWENTRDASQLPKGPQRAELARWLAVPNQPSRILQALGNKRRTREIHAPPVAEVSPVQLPSAEQHLERAVGQEPAPEGPIEDIRKEDLKRAYETWDGGGDVTEMDMANEVLANREDLPEELVKLAQAYADAEKESLEEYGGRGDVEADAQNFIDALEVFIGEKPAAKTGATKPPEMMTQAEYEAWNEKNYLGADFVPASEPGTGGGALSGFAATAYRAKAAGKPVSADAERALQDAIQGNIEHRKEMTQWERNKDKQSKLEKRAVDVTAERFEEIRKTYFADKSPKVPRVFTHEGKLRATISSEGGYERELANTWELIPADQWKGKTYTQQELYAKWNRKESERGNDTGLRVTHRGKPYVLANPITFRLKKGPEEPPAAAPEPTPPTPPTAPEGPAKPVEEPRPTKDAERELGPDRIPEVEASRQQIEGYYSAYLDAKSVSNDKSFTEKQRKDAAYEANRLLLLAKGGLEEFVSVYGFDAAEAMRRGNGWDDLTVAPVEEPTAMKPEVRAEVDRILGTIEDNQTSVRALDQLRSLKNRDQLTVDQFADLEKEVARRRIEGIRSFNPAAAHFEEKKPVMDAIMAQVGKGPGRQISESGALKDPYRYVTDALNAAQRRKVLELAESTGWRYVSESEVDPSYGRGLKTLSFKPPLEKKTPIAKAQTEVTKVAKTEGQRPAKQVKAELLKELEDAIAAAPSEEELIRKTGAKVALNKEKFEAQKRDIRRGKQVGKVTIDIPGDGIFTVINTKEALTEVLDRAKAISTAPGGPVKVTRRNVTKEQGAEFAKEAQQLAKGKPSMGPGAAAAAEFEEPEASRLSPAVYGLSAGSPWLNTRVRELENMVEGFKQLGHGRAANKKRIAQSLNAADNIPRVLGQQAGKSMRLRLPTLLEQQATTALMQALKMSGEGLEEEDLARLQENPKFKEYVGDPMGYLKVNQFDLQAYGEGQLKKGLRLEAQAAFDLAKAMQYARDHFAQLKPIAQEAKKRLDEQLLSEEARGLDTEYERWYVPQRHALDLLPSANRPIVIGESKGSGPSSQFRKAKYYEDYSSAIQAGFIPRSLSIADLMEHRVMQGERLAARKAMFEGLRRMRDTIDNKPIAITIPKRKIKRPNGTVDVRESVPLDYEPFEVMPGVRLAIHKGYARMLRALTGSSQISESAPIAAAQNVAAFEKHIGLALDTFHLVRTLITEAATTGRMSVGPRMQRGTSLLEYDIGDLDRAVQAGEISQETADWVRNPQQWEVHGRTIQASPRAIINLGLKNGLGLGRIADAIYKDWIREMPIFGTVNKLVFDKITRSAMAHGFLAEFGRVAKQHPEWTGEQVARTVGSDINVLFGNLQKESWIRSPSLNALLQIGFLAPNWVQSLIRREARSVMQIGSAVGEAIKGYPKGPPITVKGRTGSYTYQPMSHVPRLETAGKVMGTGFAVSFIGTQLLNLITRHQLTFQNQEREHLLDAWVPDPFGGGKGFFISPLAIFGEMTHELIRYFYTKPDLASDISQIGANKLGNMGRAIAVLATGRDPFTDQKIIGTPQRLAKAGVQLVPVPIILSGVGRKLVGALAPGVVQKPTGIDVERQIASSFGVKTEPAPSAQSEIRRLVDRWKMTQEPKLQADVQRRLREDFRGPYSDLRQALSRDDTGQAQRAYQQLRADGSTPQQISKTIHHAHPFAGSRALEHRFYDSLTPDQQKLYDEAIKEREEIGQRFDELLETKPQLSE